MRLGHDAWKLGLAICTAFALEGTARADEPAAIDSEPAAASPADPSAEAPPEPSAEAPSYPSTDSPGEPSSVSPAEPSKVSPSDPAPDPDAVPTDEYEATETEPSGPEPIHERYPNGALRIERQVVQDDTGNYVNHGPWKSYDQRGNLTAEGEYVRGERNGVWNRWLRNTDAQLLTESPYNDFTGPFISQATFELGKLHGKWTIYDSKQRKISEIELASGLRNGKAIWWSASGHKIREIDFRDGQVDGQWAEWGADGKLVSRDTYQMGRKLSTKTQEHSPTQKKSEGVYLFSALLLEKADDWWSLKPASYAKQGKDERHGTWTSWHPNGQKQVQGEYRNDVQVGKFTWWHANGQKALQGSFKEGRQSGQWVWWHQNGQKSIQGAYRKGEPYGRWTWWQEDGKISQALDMSHQQGVVIETPKVPADASAQPSKAAVKPQKSSRR